MAEPTSDPPPIAASSSAESSSSPSPRGEGDAVLRRAAGGTAFTLALAAIVIGGLCGAAIGYGIVNVSCPGCGGSKAAGAIIGALMGTIGVSIVAVLVLRAISEWKR